MNYYYSNNSAQRLATCCDALVQTFTAVIEQIDHTIIEGRRSALVQNEHFRTGRSKVQWPNSPHNEAPSAAVDAAPYPIDWNDTKRFYYFAGLVKGIGYRLGHRIRWGGDWDGDNDFQDQTFNDLVHFEYVGPVTK